jgi:hypothetical protein
MALLAPCGRDTMLAALTAATRPNGTVNVSKLLNAAAMAYMLFEDRGADQDEPNANKTPATP